MIYVCTPPLLYVLYRRSLISTLVVLCVHMYPIDQVNMKVRCTNQEIDGTVQTLVNV